MFAEVSDGVIVLDTPEGIEFARLCARRGALRLELVGLKKRGRTAYSICKEVYGLKGTRKRVLAQMTELIEQAHRDNEAQPAPKYTRAYYYSYDADGEKRIHAEATLCPDHLSELRREPHLHIVAYGASPAAAPFCGWCVNSDPRGTR